MTGAVVVVEAGLPQGPTSQRIELRAGGAFGKARGGQRDMAFEHASEAITHFCGGFTDDQRSRDVRSPVGILRAGVDEEYLAGHNLAVSAVGDAVMHDGAIGARTGN